ncbi:MAG TPA: DDE-type integrase/transposase/recombinase [Nitrolancea sp.]|nr:DDE-type integrase/transposase/recombinase [Nitrolancea sp.]
MRRLIQGAVCGNPGLPLPGDLNPRPRGLQATGPAQAEFVVCDQAIDSTYVATQEGWRYLAVRLDAHARRVIGWALADHLRTELALDALGMALEWRRPGAGLVPHTARGGQDTAGAYRAALAARSVTVSMSRSGACRDNALSERCVATRKAEIADAQVWLSRAAARTAIFAWIAVWYNRQRRHSALADQSPACCEEEVVLWSCPAASRYAVHEIGATSVCNPGSPVPATSAMIAGTGTALRASSRTCHSRTFGRTQLPPPWRRACSVDGRGGGGWPRG